MGIIIGKFRKNKSTYDILEKLENEIISIEEFGRSTEQYRGKVIRRFILLAFLFYFILACLLFFNYNRISPNQRLMCFIPLVAFPFIIWFIRKFLSWYYCRKLQKNEKKLIKLKEEKKKMIENVMETETYKVAKKILDKFGQEKKQETLTDVPLAANLLARSGQTGLRQRTSYLANPKQRLSFGTPKTPAGEKNFPLPSTMTLEKGFSQATPSGPHSRPSTTLALSRVGPVVPATPQLTTMPLPRSILPSNPSVFEKMMHYLVGDGPSNRYALICKNCFSHNGMAFREEVEYLSFRCCYCSHFNPARKMKPSGPKFEATPMKIAGTDDSSDSDKDTIDSELGAKTIGNLVRRSSSESDLPKPKDIETLNSSPESGTNSDQEKNSDFDNLSHSDHNVPKSPLDSGDSPETVEKPNYPSEIEDNSNFVSENLNPFADQENNLNPFECEESPMEVDQERSRNDLKDNES